MPKPGKPVGERINLTLKNKTIDIALKAFELSQNLRAKWSEADNAAKGRIVEIICLTWKVVGVSLVLEMRKPFDLVAEGLQKDSRGDWIRTSDLLVPNQAL